MRYVFGDCTLEMQLYVLHRAGRTIPLRSKVFQVLHYLLTHRDRVIAKQELCEQVWPEQFISDAALEGVIKAVRRAVGDSGRTQWCIQTRRGQGYRFVAPLVELVAAPQEDEASAELAVSTPSDVLPQESAAPPVRDAPKASRRQLTMLLCDLVDSTALAEQLDPEDLREVVLGYQAVCTEVIQRFDGYIAQYLGNGLLVYFGYPQAHEDDAQRAVRTGLGILEVIGPLNPRLKRANGVRLAVRLGIHTGLVVVGEMGGEGRQEQLALGEVPNVASRIQGLAEPNSVCISSSTHRLIQGYFTCKELGEQALRGVSQPLPVYQVLHESGAQSRLEIATPGGLTPLVGRESEVTLLLERWEQVKDGQGQVVLVSGEAGIGKSRAVQVLKDHVANEPHARLECRSSPYYENTALYPMIDLLERTVQFQRDDSPDEKLEKLEQMLRQYRLPLEETVPLFATLLSLPLSEDRYPQLNWTPQRQRQKTLETIVAMLLELSEQQPVLFVIEDNHWLDATSLELLSLLIDQTPTASILILLTYRPEFQPTWGNRSYLTQVTLNRLSRTQVARMAKHVVGGKSLPAEILYQIIEKTDGVPLFVEELTKAILESGHLKETDEHYELTEPLPSLVIPATLQDSLMARLDRLVTAKGVAQMGATIGRQFPYALLLAIAQVDEATLQRELSHLVEAELVYQRGSPPHATYTFKHALVQDAALRSLLNITRQQYHQRIATVLETQFPETGETQPELLAHHYTEANLNELAIEYWLRAGQQAIERSANLEAISHLTKGLELIQTLPVTRERIQQELMLQIALGVSLTATKGYGALDVEHAYKRAQELCQQVRETPQLFPVLYGLEGFYNLRAKLQTARELGEQHLHLAQRAQDPVLLVMAHIVLGSTLVYLGELALARSHFEQGMALYDPQQHRTQAFLYGDDPGVVCHSYAAWTLWMLGYPNQALQRSHEGLTLAQELSHPHSLAFALNFAAMVHLLRREEQATQERAEVAITLSTEQGFAFWLATGTLLRGWALAEQGQGNESIAHMRQNLDAWQAIGVELVRSFFLALLAAIYGKAGQTEEGLHALTEALALVDKNRERLWEAELHRIKGELLLTLSAEHQAKAEACFHQALTIARSQQAKSWELRAATSLARLWQSQDKHQDAYDLLAPVYGWFTEGFDTADLKDAKALLDELGEYTQNVRKRARNGKLKHV